MSDDEHSRYRDEIKHLPCVPLQVDRNNRVVENNEADGDNGNVLALVRTQTDQSVANPPERNENAQKHIIPVRHPEQSQEEEGASDSRERIAGGHVGIIFPVFRGVHKKMQKDEKK